VFSVGDSLGPYVIEAPIGAGGMGAVYRAKDTRLHRIVAVKVLQAEKLPRHEARQRFEHEARAISRLNHPNICTVHDVGHQDGVDYLVMKCLEGETLEARLKRNPLPLRDALRYGIQIADALDRAHRSGIVHRDLKPGNVMLTKDGAKVLDFGLAKSTNVPDSADQTRTGSLTNQGVVVGTLSYMAPEQLEGKEVDTRSDIFAFGCILHEMLTGRKAFVSTSQAGLIASILKAEPPEIRNLDPQVPPSLERIVLTCLQKDPEDRWQSARDVSLQLKVAAELPAATPPTSKAFRRRALLFSAGILIGGALSLLGWSLFGGRQSDALVQFDIRAPERSEFSGFGSAISPNGRYVAFAAITDGKEKLWVRPLDSRNARLLEDTEDAQFPFWAPDSNSIGFFTRNKLKRFDLNGIGSRVIATTANGRGGTWNRDGVIVYSPNLSSRLWKVSANGGEPTPATVLGLSRGDARHNFPQFLPDGQHFLFFARGTDPQRSGPHVGSLNDPRAIDAIPQLQGNSFQAVYAPSTNPGRGHLIYVRDRSLVAQDFDTGTLRLKGEPQPILSRDSFNVASSPGFLNVTVSDTGALLDGGSLLARNQLAWRKRDGTLIEVVGGICRK
jgi:serine/threonine protein kinase